MGSLVLVLCIFGSLLVVIVYALLWALLRSNSRLIEVNKQLLILVAGKQAKPETLRALVASNKPPQGNLPGISKKKKEDNKPKNTDYQMTIGLPG